MGLPFTSKIVTVREYDVNCSRFKSGELNIFTLGLITIKKNPTAIATVMINAITHIIEIFAAFFI